MSVALGGKDISGLVKSIRDYASSITSENVKFSEGQVYGKVKPFGAVRRWSLEIVESPSNWDRSLYKYILDLTAEGSCCMFYCDFDTLYVYTLVTVVSVDLDYMSEGEKPLHRLTVNLQEKREGVGAVSTHSFVDNSVEPGYVDVLSDGTFKCVVPAGSTGTALGGVKSVNKYYGGYFEAEIKGVSQNSGNASIYLYNASGDLFEEIDTELYSDIDDPTSIYASVTTYHGHFLSWVPNSDGAVNVLSYHTKQRLGFRTCDAFHRYGVNWVPGVILQFYVDGVEVVRFRGKRVPRHYDLYLHLQNMVDGSWMPTPTEDSIAYFRNPRVDPPWHPPV